MSSITSDVSPAVTTMMIDHWRATPLWQKLAYVDELNATLKVLAMSDLRRRYPGASEAVLQRRLASRWLGADLAAQVYGPMQEGEDAAH